MSQDTTNKRVTLTKAHLSTDSGKGLVSLILELGIDGEFSDLDLGRLSQWLNKAPQELPAIRHLKELIDNAIEDGFISADERILIHKQIERVLPPEERERLAEARKLFAASSKNTANKDDEVKNSGSKTDSERKSQKNRVTEAQIRYIERLGDSISPDATKEEASELIEILRNQPSEAQINYIKDLGGLLPIGATRQEASDLIESLLHSNSSITPRQQMILRFWNIQAKPNWGKSEITLWTDEWYDKDPDHQLAWELFKEENGDSGLSRNPEKVPIGIGYEYLKRIKEKKSFSSVSSSDDSPPNKYSASVIIMYVLGALLIGIISISILMNNK